MNKEETISKINEFLVEEFEVAPEKITPDATLKETLELDSLDYVDLVVIIEGNFGKIWGLRLDPLAVNIGSFTCFLISDLSNNSLFKEEFDGNYLATLF